MAPLERGAAPCFTVQSVERVLVVLVVGRDVVKVVVVALFLELNLVLFVLHVVGPVPVFLINIVSFLVMLQRHR